MHSVTTIRVSNQIDGGIEVNLNVLRTLFPTFLVPYPSWKMADLSFYPENTLYSYSLGCGFTYIYVYMFTFKIL